MFVSFFRHIIKRAVVIGAGVLAGTFLQAQNNDFLPPVSSTYAITNVTITQAPGRIINRGTVVIRNGLIHEVGATVTIPPDAIVIPGDSLYMYAGFIDGLSYTGVARPENENNDKPKDPGNPPPDRAGITPERDVRDFLNPEERTLIDIRNAGFTAAHVVPYGVFLPGKGAVIALGGAKGDDMVIKPNSSFYSKLMARPGVYPSTIIGIMAKWRELYRQAVQSKAYEHLYASNSTGLPRHCSDRILQSFYPVIENKMPVVFKAERVLDIQRALILKNDLGFSSIMLGNVKEGWDAIDKLKSARANVFLSLSLPDEEKKSETDSALSDEMKMLKKRREEFIGRCVAQAASFHKAGMKFGFSAMGMKGKHVHENLRRIVAAGLPEDYALAALTTYPAEMLGLSDRLGTVDKGKIANLVITSKPYFDEKASVKFVFVDGELVTCYHPAKNKDKKVSLEGNWSLVTRTPQGKVDLKVTLKKEDSHYRGVITGGNLPEDTQLTHVVFENGKLKFKYSVKVVDNMVEVTVEGKVVEKNFKGTMTVGEYGTYPIEGTREPNML